ncbi:GNAT family N-acetyltransferase [Methylobacterium sp. ID0610]|uniref:GNAT family N-acetyltransferase n=1 Tax=Methylobacterium carpenticola TaxID=3344827 RepID=UPI0036AA4370
MRRFAFAELLETHLRVQAGCYVSGVEAGPAGARYLWSGRIAEPGLNLAVGTGDLGWVRAVAGRHGRQPAILAADAAEAGRFDGHPALRAAVPTRWMIRPCAPAGAAALPGGMAVTVECGPAPGEAYLSVCRALYPDPAINAAAEAVYLPVLREARAVEGVETHHLTLSRNGRPVACASVYRRGDLAGLYNVGTRAEEQGRGLGALATRLAVRIAGAAGAAALMLQCRAGTHVERLYAGLGFTVAESPSLLVFAADREPEEG